MKTFIKGSSFRSEMVYKWVCLISSPYKTLLRSFQPTATSSLGCFLCNVSSFQRKNALGRTRLTPANKDVFRTIACLFSAETSDGRKYVCVRRLEASINLGASRNCRVDYYFSERTCFSHFRSVDDRRRICRTRQPPSLPS